MKFTYIQLIVLDVMNITFEDTQNEIYTDGKYLPYVWITIIYPTFLFNEDKII